jgi:hypothetical protein
MRVTPAVVLFFSAAGLLCISAEIEDAAISVEGETIAAAVAEIKVHNALYSDIRPANLTDSLRRIMSTEFVNYRFQYDSVADRVQMGVIGLEAQKYFPESIDIVPKYTFSNKDRTKAPVVLTNFPIIGQ